MMLRTLARAGLRRFSTSSLVATAAGPRRPPPPGRDNKKDWAVAPVAIKRENFDPQTIIDRRFLAAVSAGSLGLGLRAREGEPDDQTLCNFIEVLLKPSATTKQRDLLWQMYTDIRASSPRGVLVQLIPLIPRFLSHLSCSYLITDQERILSICDDVKAALRQMDGNCVCSQSAVLGDAHNREILAKHWICRARTDKTQVKKTRGLVERPRCTIASGHLTQRVFGYRIVALARLGRPDDALAELDAHLGVNPRMREFSEHHLCTVMDAFAAQGRTEHVVSMYERYAAWLNRSARAANLVLAALVRRSDFDTAVDVFGKLDPDRVLNATHVTTLASGLVDAGHPHAALQLYQSFHTSPVDFKTGRTVGPPKFIPDTAAVTVAIQAYAAQGNIDAALHVFRSMFHFMALTQNLAAATALPVTGPAVPEWTHLLPTARTYAAVIKALLAAGRVADAAAMHHEMTRGEGMVAIPTTTSVIQHLLRALPPDDVEDAVAQVLVDAIHAGGVPDARLTGCLAAAAGRGQISHDVVNELLGEHRDIAAHPVAQAKLDATNVHERAWSPLRGYGSNSAKQRRLIRVKRRRAPFAVSAVFRALPDYEGE
ncbi:hypothetical protein H9P43_001038 [Blastocladiella emersonii ATCC 22665]|nr:hypothetical protein H9P43_001038 [Blastocladiella emersonii ATCC 22665]